jgi:integrase
VATIQTVTSASGQKRYKVRWWEGPGRQRKRTFDKFEDARRYKTQVERQLDTGEYIDPSRGRVTLAAWFDLFMESSQLEPATQARYRTHARLYLIPALGSRRLATITRGDVENLLSALRASGIGAATICAVHQLLRRLLSAAVKSDRITRNVASGVDIEQAQSREQRILSPAQVSSLADAVPLRDRALILTLAYCGLRIGEAAGLRVKHLNLFKGTIEVAVATKEISGHLIAGKTKTKRIRSVRLPAFLRDELAQHLASFSDPGNPEAYVFTAAEGGPLRANNWRKRVFYPACKRAGLEPAPHVHDMRHTAASLAIAAGAHPKAIQEMLGHSSITTTLDLYGHLQDTLQEQTAGALDAMYRSVGA